MNTTTDRLTLDAGGARTAPHEARRAGERGFSMIELVVVGALIGVVSAIAVSTSLGNYRLIRDARGLKNQITLARMQAAANFTRARLYVDLAARTYRIETWRSTGTPAWVPLGGTMYLSSAEVLYGFGPVSAPPPHTQATLGQAPQCRDASGEALANTACIVFNSRGIPVDSTGAPTGVDAIYVTDRTAVFGMTVSATSIVQLWRTNPTATPTWVLQ